MIDTRELFFDGNSEGGIMGGAATAVARDWTRAVIGVPAMNYSTLLQRSTDWDTYKAIFDPAYPDPTDHVLSIGIIQMLWDRGEADGYAQHLTRDPYPGTPAHEVLIHEAFGDHQVANIATEVEARSIGARVHRPALADGRSTSRHQLWGMEELDGPYDGSSIVVWDSGAPAPPAGNVAPRDGEDPHGDPRRSKEAREQKSEFLKRHGRVVDVCGGRPCTAPARGRGSQCAGSSAALTQTPRAHASRKRAALTSPRSVATVKISPCATIGAFGTEARRSFQISGFCSGNWALSARLSGAPISLNSRPTRGSPQLMAYCRNTSSTTSGVRPFMSGRKFGPWPWPHTST